MRTLATGLRTEPLSERTRAPPRPGTGTPPGCASITSAAARRRERGEVQTAFISLQSIADRLEIGLPLRLRLLLVVRHIELLALRQLALQLGQRGAEFGLQALLECGVPGGVDGRGQPPLNFQLRRGVNPGLDPRLRRGSRCGRGPSDRS